MFKMILWKKLLDDSNNQINFTNISDVYINIVFT